MSGWGAITWLAAMAVGPLTFLALVAHRVANCAIRLERLNEEQRKSQQRRGQANPPEIVLESIDGHKTSTQPADKAAQRGKKVDQPLG